MPLPRLSSRFLTRSKLSIGAQIMTDNPQDALGLPLAKPLDEAAIREFSSNVRGQLIRPEDDGYDAARLVFNGMVNRRPALIVRCAGVADVVGGVEFARSH